MNDFDFQRLTESECVAVFNQLFPRGFHGADVLLEIAPGGWGKSALATVFHPSPEQLFEESVRLHRNLLSLPWRKADTPHSPPPTREEVIRDYRPQPFETEREVRELVGLCLWDVFSDNHDVIAPDGRIVELGSFRASGGFIADYLNEKLRLHEYDYINFFMGTAMLSQRADLTPVYEMIFRRLRQNGFDWRYSFPELRLVDMRPLLDSLKHRDKTEWANYSPDEAFAREQEQKNHDEEVAEMRNSLKEAHREAIEEALKLPPPRTVDAYRQVYAEFPAGWPPRG